MKSSMIKVKASTNVLMIGNGFDISYKFPTKYSNFLHVVDCLSRFIVEGKPILSVAQVFNDSALQKSDKDIKKLVEAYKDKYDEDLDQDIIKVAFCNARNNLWFQYLSKSLRDGGWIDFEQEIKMVVKQVSFALDNLIEETSEGVFLHFPVTDGNTQVNYVCKQFSCFFEKEGVQSAFGNDKNAVAKTSWRHSVLAAYTEKPRDEGFPYKLKKTEVVDCLFEELKMLSRMLRDYLYWFVDKPVSALKGKGMSGDCLLQTWPWAATQVISFNYTHTLKELYGVDDYPKTHYIHGEIDDNSEIVLGVDSDSQDEAGSVDTTFVKFKKYYQRANYGTDLSYLNYMYYNSMSSTYDLYVIGHSLDVTDREIITETFARAKRIIVFYHNDDSREKHIKNLIAILGKERFESLRKKNMLRFVTQNNLEMEWDTFQSIHNKLS